MHDVLKFRQLVPVRYGVSVHHVVMFAFSVRVLGAIVSWEEAMERDV